MLNVRMALLFLLSLSVHAEDNMKFYGTLIKAPNCHINSGEPIEVKFGNMGINKVDGNNYLQDINYTITCDGESQEELYLSVNGTGVAYNSAAVKASVDNLAIEIRQDGKPFVLGSKIRVNSKDSPPELTAVPVKNGDKPLVAADFSAAATLIAFYQ